LDVERAGTAAYVQYALGRGEVDSLGQGLAGQAW
jgi:hypothetical protein